MLSLTISASDLLQRLVYEDCSCRKKEHMTLPELQEHADERHQFMSRLIFISGEAAILNDRNIIHHYDIKFAYDIM